jgi:hypothetical protein
VDLEHPHYAIFVKRKLQIAVAVAIKFSQLAFKVHRPASQMRNCSRFTAHVAFIGHAVKALIADNRLPLL